MDHLVPHSSLRRSAKLGTETLVFLDLGSRRNNDTAQLKSVLEAKLRQGRLASGEGGGLEVREPGDNWFRVISGPGQSINQLRSTYHESQSITEQYSTSFND